jgi:hypothetical protein
MNKAATILLILGTIVGAFGGARLPQADPLVSAIGVLLLVAGCVLIYSQGRANKLAAANAVGGVPVFELMRALPDQLQPILDQSEQLSLAEITERLSALDLDYFRPIADASPALLNRMGAESFAAVFGLYASGERLISRAWSAAVDQHRPETIASLHEGLARIRQAAAAIPSGVR